MAAAPRDSRRNFSAIMHSGRHSATKTLLVVRARVKAVNRRMCNGVDCALKDGEREEEEVRGGMAQMRFRFLYAEVCLVTN